MRRAEHADRNIHEASTKLLSDNTKEGWGELPKCNCKQDVNTPVIYTVAYPLVF
jgi:hypothetical protein